MKRVTNFCLLDTAWYSLFICIIFVCPLYTSAGPNNVTTPHNRSWSMGPLYGVTNINSNSSVIQGFQLDYTFNQQYYLGFMFGGLPDKIKNTDRQFSYSGLYAGYIFHRESNTYFSADFAAGGGELTVETGFFSGVDPDTFSYVRPRLNINFTLNRISELELSLSYRQVSSSTYTLLSDSDLSGYELTIGLMFGRF